MNDTYLHYNLEDYLTDELFLVFVKGEDKKLNDSWESWLSMHPDQLQICAEAKKIISTLNFDEDLPSEVQTEKMWKNIHTSISSEKDKKTTKIISIASKKQSWKTWAIGLVASFVLIIAYTSWDNSQLVEINTIVSERKSVALPDQSMVELRENSNLSYDADKWESERNLQLSGEAFFKVKKGNKFSVYTDHAIIQVLGTSFNVSDKDKILDVSCETGIVRVISLNAQDTVILRPGDGVSKTPNDKMRIYHFDTRNNQSNKSSIVSFEQKKLVLVFKELEKRFKVKIEVNTDISSLLYTGHVKMSDLERSLYSICWPMHLKYEIKHDKVIITK